MHRLVDGLLFAVFGVRVLGVGVSVAMHRSVRVFMLVFVRDVLVGVAVLRAVVLVFVLVVLPLDIFSGHFVHIENGMGSSSQDRKANP